MFTSSGFSFHPHTAPSADTISACVFSTPVCALTVSTCATCKRRLTVHSQAKG